MSESPSDPSAAPDAAALRLLRLSLLPAAALLLAMGWAAVQIGGALVGQVGTGMPFLFAAGILALYAVGYRRARSVLEGYAREEQALPKCADGLRALATAERRRVADGFPETGEEEEPPDVAIARALGDLPVPLLRHRLVETLRTLRRGAPLLATDLAEAEEKHFPGPERDLRACMDIALNLGIAGTFLSVILMVAVRGGGGVITADMLLAHIGPGLVSGLAGVLANVALRLCHSAVVAQQDRLAERVGGFLADMFVGRLPRVLTSPDERLAVAVENRLEQQMRALHELLLRQLMEPVGAIAQHAGELARQSGAWGDAVRDLKNANADLVTRHREAEERHEKRMAGLFEGHEKALAGLTETAVQRQAETAAGLLEQARAQYAQLQREQAEQARRLLEEMLNQFGGAVAQRASEMESQVSGVLDAMREGLPQAVRESMGAALGDAVELVHLVREQAGVLAQAVDQVSQNADRQVRAYEQWAARVEGWQTRLEETLTAAQAAQETTLAAWNARAGESLARLDRAFASAAEKSQAGHQLMTDAVRLLAEQAREMSQNVQAFQNEVRGFHAPLATLGTALAQLPTPMTGTGTAMTDLRASAHSLTKALALVGEGELHHRESLSEVREAAHRLSDTLARVEESARRVAEALRFAVQAASGSGAQGAP